MRKALRAVGTLLVSVVLIAVLLHRVGVAELAETLRGVKLRWLLAAAALGPVQIVLSALRWQLASRQLGLSLGKREAILEYLLGSLLNQLLPGGVAGDARRVWRQRDRGLKEAMAAAFLDRGAGQILMVGAAVVGVATWAQRPPGLLAALLGLVALMGFICWPLRERIRVAMLAPEALPLHFLYSTPLFLSIVGGVALSGFAVGHPLGWELVHVVPLILVAMALPISFGGWGPRELSAVFLLPAFGWSELDAAALATTYGVSCLLGTLPGALAPLVSRGS